MLTLIILSALAIPVSYKLQYPKRVVTMTPELWERLNPGTPYPLDN